MKNLEIDQELIDDLRAVLRRAEDLVEATADTPGEKLKVARERLSHGIAGVRDQWTHLEDRATQIARRSGQVIRDHPYETAGTGILLLGCVAFAVLLWQRTK